MEKIREQIEKFVKFDEYITEKFLNYDDDFESELQEDFFLFSDSSQKTIFITDNPVFAKILKDHFYSLPPKTTIEELNDFFSGDDTLGYNEFISKTLSKTMRAQIAQNALSGIISLTNLYKTYVHPDMFPIILHNKTLPVNGDFLEQKLFDGKTTNCSICKQHINLSTGWYTTPIVVWKIENQDLCAIDLAIQHCVASVSKILSLHPDPLPSQLICWVNRKKKKAF